MIKMTRRAFVLSSFSVLAFPTRAFSSDRESLRFGIVTDSHYADYESRGSRYYRESLDKMSECVEVMNGEKVDFLVELGDFKDGARNPSTEDALDFLEKIESTFSRFDGPCYHALGNHDMDTLSKKQFLSRINNTGIDAEKTYYSFDSGPVHFVVLDPNFNSEWEPYDSGNFRWTDANIPPEQLEWLSADLRDTDKPSLIMLHQCLDGEGGHFVNNAAEVREVLEDSDQVLAVLQGHNHGGAYRFVEKIHYYTLRAMVEGSGCENNSYAIVALEPDRLVVEGYRRAVDRELDL